MANPVNFRVNHLVATPDGFHMDVTVVGHNGENLINGPIVIQTQRSFFERMQDVALGLAVPLAGMGVYTICSLTSGSTGIDLAPVFGSMFAVGAGAGTLFVSENARNAASSAISFTGNVAVGTVCLSGRALKGLGSLFVNGLGKIGNGTEWVAGQAPAFTGAAVGGATLYGMHESGLDSLAVQAISAFVNSMMETQEDL